MKNRAEYPPCFSLPHCGVNKGTWILSLKAKASGDLFSSV
jgi:hypothetical protein